MQNIGFKFRHPRKRKECFDTKGKRVFVLEKYKKALKKWKDEDETYTNEKFAEMVGVDFGTVYRWENGSEVPWQKNIDRIEEVLGTSVSSYEVNIDNCLDDNCTENMSLFLEIINLQYGIKTSRIVSLIRTLSGIVSCLIWLTKNMIVIRNAISVRIETSVANRGWNLQDNLGVQYA